MLVSGVLGDNFGQFLVVYTLGPIIGALIARVRSCGTSTRTELEEAQHHARPRGHHRDPRRGHLATSVPAPSADCGRRPAPARRAPAAARRRIRRLRSADAPPRHVLAQLHAVAVAARASCYCKYCAFATHKAHLYSPDEVERAARPGAAAARQGAARSSPASGPRSIPASRARLEEYGHEDFTSYVVWACERALERGLLPHTNLGVLRPRGPGAAARGDGLAGADARVDLRAPDGDRPRRLADQAPARRLETIRAAGELKIPFTSGILVGIGETEDERIASLEALAAGARRVRPHPGGDPPELRPARALLRPRAGADRRRGRAALLGDGDRRSARPAAAGVGLRGHDRGHDAPRRRGARG